MKTSNCNNSVGMVKNLAKAIKLTQLSIYLAVGVVPMLYTNAAFAGGVISKGVVEVGLNDQANLIDLSTNIGINYSGVGDGISPGCPCEG